MDTSNVVMAKPSVSTPLVRNLLMKPIPYICKATYLKRTIHSNFFFRNIFNVLHKLLRHDTSSNHGLPIKIHVHEREPESVSLDVHICTVRSLIVRPICAVQN